MDRASRAGREPRGNERTRVRDLTGKRPFALHDDRSALDRSDHRPVHGPVRIFEHDGERLGELSALRGELAVAEAGGRRGPRHPHRGQELSRREGGRERPAQEGGERLGARAGRAIDPDLRVQRGQHHRPVRGRVRVREAPADRAPVADRPVGDVAGRPPEPPRARIGNRAVLDLRVGDAGAVDHGVRRVREPAKLRAFADVDE